MRTIQRVSEPTFHRSDGPDGHVWVRFRLNREPEPAWFDLFQRHAASSAVTPTQGVLDGRNVALEITRRLSPTELATALDCFIECANLKLRSWGASDRRPVAPRHRSRAHT